MSGVLGTILALAGILDHFVGFVFSLGIIFTPVAGIYVIDYFLIQRDLYLSGNTEVKRTVSVAAFVAWLIGIAIAVAADAGFFTVTRIAAIDSLLATSLIYWALQLQIFTGNKK